MPAKTPPPPKRPLSLFIGHRNDARAEAAAVFALRERLKEWFDNQRRQHGADFPFEHLAVYQWAREMSANIGGQEHIDAVIDQSLIGVFIFNVSVGDGTEEELHRMRKRVDRPKPHILCCFRHAPGIGYGDDALAAYTKLCELRKRLEDWDRAGTYATKPLDDYTDKDHLQQLVFEHLTTKDIPDLILKEKARRDTAVNGSANLPVPPQSGPLESRNATDDEYGALASDIRRTHGRINFIGVGGGEMTANVDDIYVSLRITERNRERVGGDHAQTVDGTLAGRDTETDIAGMLRMATDDERFPVVLGEPGAGKTTALRKLLSHTLSAPESLGLPAGTVPVFLRLRALSGDKPPKNLAAFIEAELTAHFGDKFSGYGEPLWERGRLLLLLDGLDEISNAAERLRAVHFLESELTVPRDRQIHAVVSSRFTGYGGDILLGDRFMSFAVRELDEDDVDELVRLWFRVSIAHTGLSPEDSRARGERLCQTLKEADYSTQQIAVMVSNPLLLTLLCIVVMQGGQIPKRRTDFYRECLRTLLVRWVAQRDHKPLLEFEIALSVLADVAWTMHTAGRRDDLSPFEFIGLADRRFETLGPETPDSADVFDWLVDATGVLTEYATGHYGFAHLGFQEYLAGLEAHRAARTQILTDNIDDKWWEECVLLACGLPTNSALTGLATALIERELKMATPTLTLGSKTGTLLQRCQDEALAPSPEPWLELLKSEHPEHQAFALGRLTHFQTNEVREAAYPFIHDDDPAIKRFARQITRGTESAEGSTGIRNALLLCHSDDAATCHALADALASETGDGEFRVIASDDVPRDRKQSKALLDTPAAFVFGGEGGAIWHSNEGAGLLGALSKRDVHLIPVVLPNAQTPDPTPVALGAWRALPRDADVSAIAAMLIDGETAARSGKGPSAGADDDHVWVDALTGTRFLWVSGGHFEMGSETLQVHEDFAKLCRPIHTVQLTGYWLAETPITNRQYALFMDQGDGPEPRYWRDRRFSHPDQPVVGVSWHDAMAFCEWMSQASGRAVFLPSEAQWERAARGADARPFPWGDKEPNEARARFNQDPGSGRPTTVGALPAGAGPYGHLDLAGNVWEWCHDSFQADLYEKRAGSNVVDPAVRDQTDSKVLRGGGWRDPAGVLASAIRIGLPAGNRNNDVGFRVASALEC
ncbi:MAG: SUMF1/EgtB/PvdO family nonheme iron enzyme [Pseudomonadota bacterium]